MQNGQFVTASYDGGPLSGINAGLGQVLGYHMAQVYDAWAGIPDSGAASCSRRSTRACLASWPP